MILLIQLAIGRTVPLEADNAPFASKRVAVLVGVQDYADPALQDLAFARKDAHDMAAVLSSPDLGGFDRVFVIDNSVLTTREALYQTLELASTDLGRDDTFLLYMSGHGTLTLDPAEGSRLWFLPSDARLDNPEATGVAIADLEDWMSSLPAKRRVLIMDTCHNGRQGSKSTLSAPTNQLLQGFRGEPPAPLSVQEISESEARLFAAGYYQPAMEDPELKNGVYTHFLLESLTTGASTADLNGDSLVDITEAHQYARDRTIAYTGGLQVPRAEYRIVGREEIFLAGRESDRSAAEAALISACDLLLSRAKLLVNGTPRGEFPGLYAIEPGVQEIEVQAPDGRVLLRERVRFEAGRAVALEDLMAKKAASVSVLGGVGYIGGNSSVPAIQSSFSLIWSRPIPMSSLWRPDLHIAAGYGTGSVEDMPGLVSAGSFSAGATLGLEPGDRFWFGPSLDLRLPWRLNPDTREQQWQVTGSGGLSAGFSLPVTNIARLELRFDGWGGAWDYGGQLTPTYGAELKIGVGVIP